MTTRMAPIRERDLSLNAVASGNGTTVDVTGALRTLFRINSGGTVTGGAITLQESSDGSNWSAITDARLLQDGDAGTADADGVITVPTTADVLVYAIGHRAGPTKVRAIVSTALTGTSPTVTVSVIRIGGAE